MDQTMIHNQKSNRPIQAVKNLDRQLSFRQKLFNIVVNMSLRIKLGVRSNLYL